MAIVALGFCTADAGSIESMTFPGWPLEPNASFVHSSWAYHGDDGGYFASDRQKGPLQYGKHYGPGDTVGCGLELAAQKIFFTRNGIRDGEKLC